MHFSNFLIDYLFLHRAPKALQVSFFVCLFVCVLTVLGAGASFAASPSLSSLEKRLATEQQKAKERRASLARLTDQERKLDTDLAQSEKNIDAIEERLAKLEEQLGVLAKSDTQAEREYETILAEQSKVVAAQQDILRLLWHVAMKRESVGSRDMLDWDATDREYRWSHDLLIAFGSYQKELAGHQKDLEAVLERRAKYAQEIEANFAKANIEKSTLLKSRIQFAQKLDKIRSQKEDAEAELTRLLKLVDSLNFQIVEAGGNIPQQKGRLPWPAKGKLAKRFAPSGNPPCRGVGLSTAEGATVKSIAAGKVVHNDLLRGFGTVLILQHGEEYYSLYAFLGQSILRVGQSVAKEENIGKVGFYPDIHGPGMYFELRFRQKAINPEQWLRPS